MEKLRAQFKLFQEYHQSAEGQLHQFLCLAARSRAQMQLVLEVLLIYSDKQGEDVFENGFHLVIIDYQLETCIRD